MVYDGYLRMGGNEIVNSPRAEGFTRSFDCYVPWLVGESCPFLQDAIGDSPYSYANIASAPWYDPSNPEVSSRVLGVYGMGFTGVKDSTRSVQVTEGLDDGGVIGSMRKGVRQVRARIAIVAIGDDAMEYARTWLEAALDPGACGQHAEECGTTDVEYLAACPPERGTVSYLSDWTVQQTNLIPYSDFELGTGTTVVRTQRLLNPNFEVDTASWSPTVGSATISRTTAQAHRGTAALQVVAAGTVAGEGAYSTPGAGGAITAGTAFSGAAWVYAPAGAKMEIYATCTGTGGTPVITRFDGTGAWQYVKAEGALPPSNLNPYIIVRTSTAAGQAAQALTFYVDEAIMEYNPTIGSYFDGGSRPILRSNLVRDPAPTAATLWDAVGGSTRTYASGEITVVCPGSAANEGISTYSNTAQSIEAAVSGGMWVNAPAGAQLYVEVRANSQSTGAARTNFTGTGTWQYVTAQGASSTVAGGVHLVMVRTQSATAVTFKVKQAILQVGPTVGTYFDGGSTKAGYSYSWSGAANGSASIEQDADFSTRWAGTANNSASELTGVPITGWRAQDSVFIVSSRWSKSGSKSGRIIPTSASTNTYVEVNPAPTSPAAPLTGIATIHLEAPLTGTLGSKTRRGSFYWTGGVADSPTLSNTAGDQEVRLSASPVAANTRFLIWHGGAANSGDVWVDLAALVAGTYAGPAFNGRSTPTDPTMERYAWTGTVDASTSTYETKQWLTRPQTDDEYAAVVDPLRRYLHGVAATGGPTTVDAFRRNRAMGGTIIGELVEFTLTASRPWVYGVTKPVTLPSTTPFVIEDIRYNLVKFPSMQLTSDTLMLIGQNYSTNPSVETNTTGWSFSQSGAITAAQLSGVRSTELAAVGTASYKVVFTSTTTGSGTMSALQTVPLPAPAPLPAVYRFSVNMWAAALATTGTPTLSTIAFSVDWLNSSNAVLRTDALGTAPASGGSVTVSNILPPTGATQARVSATVTVSSIASGNVVNLFADALAVTIP